IGLEDTDIPHQKKILTLMTNEFDDEYQNLKNDLKESLGRVSLTSDLWSDINLRSFMAVTAHWLARGKINTLELRSALI
ncbi:hypothetical protein BC827DRAFT_1086744, partial [Russula dissimulans]